MLPNPGSGHRPCRRLKEDGGNKVHDNTLAAAWPPGLPHHPVTQFQYKTELPLAGNWRLQLRLAGRPRRGITDQKFV